jgi:hypothetical protein
MRDIAYTPGAASKPVQREDSMVRACVTVAVAACLILNPAADRLAARAAVADGNGTLSIASDPPGATVYVDGRFVGETPIDVPNLQPGDHRVRLVKDGYLENGRIVSITAGRTGTLQVRLTARTAADGLPEGQAGGGISSGGGGGVSKKWLWLGLAGGGAAATAVILATRNHAPALGSVTASPSAGLVSATTISFSTSASDDDGDALTYNWDFGDGATATGAAASHLYTTTNTFTVRVTVSDGSKEVSGSTTVNIRSLTGTWRGTLPGTFPVVGTFVLTQTGTVISGTYSDQFGPATISSGSQVRSTSPRVTMIINQPPFTPFVFTADPSSDVNTLTGVLNESGFVNSPLTITRQ